MSYRKKTEIELNEIRKIICDPNEICNKEIEITKKDLNGNSGAQGFKEQNEKCHREHLLQQSRLNRR